MTFRQRSPDDGVFLAVDVQFGQTAAGSVVGEADGDRLRLLLHRHRDLKQRLADEAGADVHALMLLTVAAASTSVDQNTRRFVEGVGRSPKLLGNV